MGGAGQWECFGFLYTKSARGLHFLWVQRPDGNRITPAWKEDVTALILAHSTKGGVPFVHPRTDAHGLCLVTRTRGLNAAITTCTAAARDAKAKAWWHARE